MNKIEEQPGRQRTIRAAWIASAVALMACAGSPESDSEPSVDTAAPCHPLVPEPFCFRWETSTPCLAQGLAGRRVYRVGEGGRVSEDGTFEITEKWYWFLGDPAKPEQDVVDTLRYGGNITTRWSGERMLCADCEVVVSAAVEVVDNPSGWLYGDEANSVFAFDTLNANGYFNQGYRTRMTKGVLTERGEPQVDWPDYGQGTWKPDNELPGALPASVTWEPPNVSGDCY